jgi:hypothetical protein
VQSVSPYTQELRKGRAATLKRTLIALLCSVLLLGGAASAWAALPASEAEFDAQFASWDDPEQVAQAFLTAVLVRTHGDKTLGGKLLDKVMASDKWDKTQPVLTTALDETAWVFDSYVDDPAVGEISVSRVTNHETEVLGIGELACVYLDSEAADQPRPLVLRKLDGKWKVASPSPLCVGLKSADGNPGDDIAATTKMGDTLHLWLEATYLYVLGLKEEGRFVLDHVLASKGFAGDIDSMLAVANTKPYIFYSYATGTKVDDAYVSFDPFFFRIEITRDEVYGGREDHRKAFVRSSGADTPRPFQCLLTKRGQCRMYEFSTLRVDCRPPQKENW